jgi:hypothetical protein
MADHSANEPAGLLPQPGPSETLRVVMQGAKSGMRWRRLLPPAAVSIGLHLFLLPFLLAITVTFADQLLGPPTCDANTTLDNDPGWHLELDRDYEVAGVGEDIAVRENQSVQGAEVPEHYILINAPDGGDHFVDMRTLQRPVGVVRQPLAPTPQAEPAGVASAADAEEALYEAFRAIITRLTGVLQTVVNENTAQAAVPEIKKIVLQLQVLEERAKKLGPADHWASKLRKQLWEQCRTEIERYNEQVKRLLLFQVPTNVLRVETSDGLYYLGMFRPDGR